MQVHSVTVLSRVQRTGRTTRKWCHWKEVVDKHHGTSFLILRGCSLFAARAAHISDEVTDHICRTAGQPSCHQLFCRTQDKCGEGQGMDMLLASSKNQTTWGWRTLVEGAIGCIVLAVSTMWWRDPWVWTLVAPSKECKKATRTAWVLMLGARGGLQTPEL